MLPTGDELRAIRNATDLFKSSSFKLQIDALLPNLRPKASRIPPLDQFLLSLHAFIMDMAPVPPRPYLDGAQELLKKGVSIPPVLPMPTEETNWKVAFERPSDIILVGSWANKLSVKSKDDLKYGVDVAVEMPNSLFQEKDYLNSRFFHKRAFYLATIAAAVQKSSTLGVDVFYDSLRGDPRLTKIVLTPRPDGSANDFTGLHAQICIIPTLSATSPIPLPRLSPSHSNLRVTIADSSQDNAEFAKSATPNYNTGLLMSLLPRSQLISVHRLNQESPAIADALTLLRLWANQRGYSEGAKMCVRGFDGCGPWWISILEMLILGEECVDASKGSNSKSLGRGLSSYQLFKAALNFLAKHNFATTPVFVKSTSGHRFPPETYRNHHGAVFVESSSLVNVLAGIPLGSLDMLRYDASLTLRILEQTSSSGDPYMDVLVLDHRSLVTRFDTLLRVDISSVQPRTPSVESVMDHSSPRNAAMFAIDSYLRRALGDRARAVAILHPSPRLRPLSQALPTDPDSIFIGIVHHPDHAFRMVDHGPAAGETDRSLVEQFHNLWGPKAELRRFQDGRIVESVAWDVKTADERTHVPAMVTRYILGHHFGLQDDRIQTWQTGFDATLRLPESVSRLYSESKISTGFKSALSAFDNLVRSIKALENDMPLSLLNVSPTSELLRYTSTFTPAPLPPSLVSVLPQNALYLTPIEIVLEFEKSSRWPDDLSAIQKIKLAFFERIGTLLMKSVDGLKASIVVGEGLQDPDIMDVARLEIVTSEGWAFTARIWHDREATLLDRAIGGNNALPHVAIKEKVPHGKQYHDAVNAKETYVRRYIHAPRHHRAIASLSHECPAFPGTARLVKRWLASHWLLHSHISEEVVEIICAKFFVGDGRRLNADPSSYPLEDSFVPGSKERGFACVLQFLKNWKWEEGLFVPIHGSTVQTEGESVKERLSGSGVWIISTGLDESGRIWTANGPDILAANRVRALASAAWDYLQRIEQGDFVVQTLFLHPTKDYDVIAHLDPTVLPRYLHNVGVEPRLLRKNGKYANICVEQTRSVMPGFDPAFCLVKDLQRIYADTLRIFYDPFGGSQFGLVWDPSLKESRQFRVLAGFSSAPVAQDNEKSKSKNRRKGMIKLNEEAIVHEIGRLGSGLIQSISLQIDAES